jgi:hypothetical protein
MRRGMVGGEHAVDVALQHAAALLDPQRAIAHLADLRVAVRDEHDRGAAVDAPAQRGAGFFLELEIADREHLVDQQHVGLDLDRDRKAQAHDHAGRVARDRLVEKVAQLGKLEDRRQPPHDLAPAQAEHEPGQHRIVAPGQVRHEAQCERQQLARHRCTADAAAVRRDDAGHGAQKCTFARAVAADHAEAVARREAQAHVLERPEARTADAQLRVEGDADVVELDDRRAHVGSFT